MDYAKLYLVLILCNCFHRTALWVLNIMINSSVSYNKEIHIAIKNLDTAYSRPFPKPSGVLECIVSQSPWGSIITNH